jgi:flagellar biogenesis protein FliO
MEIFGDIFGGFMVMLFILGFFLVAIWFILPFVIFSMKGRVESAHLLLENIDKRLTAIEEELRIDDHSSK